MFKKASSSKYQLDRSRSARSDRHVGAPLETSCDDIEAARTKSQDSDSDSDCDSGNAEKQNGSESDSSAGPSQNPRSRRSSTPRKAVMDEDEDESVNESDEEERSPPKSQRAARGRKRPLRGRKASNDDDDEDDVFEFDASSSDEDEDEEPRKPKRSSRQMKRTPTKKVTTARRGHSTVSRRKTDLLESSEEDEEDPTASSRAIRRATARKKNSGATTPRTRSTRNGKKAASYPQDSLARLPSPKRSSAVKARNKVRDVSQIEEKGSDQDIDSGEASEEENDFEPSPQQKRSTKRGNAKQSLKKRNTTGSSDEEFQADFDSDSSRDSSLIDAFDDEDDEIAKKSDESYQEDEGNDGMALDENRRAVNIDDEQVGTADESSGDEEVTSSPRRPADSRDNEIRPSPRKGTFEYSEPSDSENEEDSRNPAKRDESGPRLPACTSLIDAITSEELPRRHICYISPDGLSRQCFKLETLRQIALQSSQLALRSNLDGSQVQNFLQPPHFRTAASDDLLDQIASRFGRDALDLHGSYYKEKERRENIQEDSSGEESDDEDVYALSTFQNSMQRYLNKTMGSSDLYVCPLCYDQSYRKLNPPSEDQQAVESEYVYDPMEVLGSLDQQEFQIAAQFCFSKASDVKKHLASAHNIDPRGVQGNDLYARYKIRTPDGLLQRWLANFCKGARQGSMRQYWHQGNNQSFILLLDLAKRARLSPDEDGVPEDEVSEGADSDSDGEKTYREKAEEFWNSFAGEAQSLWKVLSRPFEKDNENMKNFITRDGEVEEDSDEEVANHAELHRKWAAKEDEGDANGFVDKLERIYAEGEGKKRKSSDESSASSEEEEELEFVDEQDLAEEEQSDDDDEAELVKKKGYYSPVEEETDDWMLSRMDRRSRKSTTPSSDLSESATKRKAVASATPVGKKIQRRKSSISSTSKTPTAPIQLSASKRTPAIRDDSSEED